MVSLRQNAGHGAGARPHIVVLDDLEQVALASADWSAVSARARLSVFSEHIADPDLVIRALADADAIVVMRERTPLSARILAALPRLRLIVTTGMRNAAIDLQAACRHGILVCGTAGSGWSAAELAWALLLALAKRVPAADRLMHSGQWPALPGIDLDGRTLGLLGLGRLGGRVAGYARAFGMRVQAWSPHLSTERAAEAEAVPVSKQALFETSDFVSLHLRLSPATRGIVGADELARLGPHGYLINTSRGALVDGAALRQALAEKSIAGAGLDVFETEPLPLDDPLRHAPNVVLTPHLGYSTTETYALLYRQVVEDLLAWLDDTPRRVLEPQASPAMPSARP